MLGELLPVQGVEGDLFSQIKTKPWSAVLMSTMDSINRKMGKDAVRLAIEGFRRPWKMKEENKSPAYTSKWSDLPVTG